MPGENEKRWKPALVVLTEKDLLMYESMPRIKEAWFKPLHSYPLLATRYLGVGREVVGAFLATEQAEFRDLVIWNGMFRAHMLGSQATD